MISKCCRAPIYAASSIEKVQLYSDWYECSHCQRPCDTVNFNLMESIKDD